MFREIKLFSYHILSIILLSLTNFIPQFAKNRSIYIKSFLRILFNKLYKTKFTK